MFSGPGWKETVLSTIFALHQSQQAAVEHEEGSWLNFAVSEIREVYLVKGNTMKMRSLKLKDLTAAVNRRRGAEMVGYFRTRGVATWDKTTCWLRPVWSDGYRFFFFFFFAYSAVTVHPHIHRFIHSAVKAYLVILSPHLFWFSTHWLQPSWLACTAVLHQQQTICNTFALEKEFCIFSLKQIRVMSFQVWLQLFFFLISVQLWKVNNFICLIHILQLEDALENQVLFSAAFHVAESIEVLYAAAVILLCFKCHVCFCWSGTRSRLCDYGLVNCGTCFIFYHPTVKPLY